MAYSELVKNFERVREYMRVFYVYGFKNRNEFSSSARTYDDEKRRIEGWLDGYMGFSKNSKGKNVFISVDTRSVSHNPLYRAWKTKSFTGLEITLHFLILDILYSPQIKKTVREIVFEVYNRLLDVETYEAGSESINESTVRKKLKEYVKLGILVEEKKGKIIHYRRSDMVDISPMTDILDFFSEAAPVGVVGSTLLDKTEPHEDIFRFKHHHMTSSIDSEVLAFLLEAVQKRNIVKASYLGRRDNAETELLFVPLKVLISAVNGRQYVVGYDISESALKTYRVDFMYNTDSMGECTYYEDLAKRFSEIEKYMWGVNCNFDTENIQRVEFDVCVGEKEEFIVNRLMREKRCGTVTKKSDSIYTFSADVFDITELIPWIRTFICRITRLEFSDKVLEERFKNDLVKLYDMYNDSETADKTDEEDESK